MKDKKYRKVRDHCHYPGEYRHTAQNMCNFKYSVPKITNNDYHFIIKRLAEELKKQFTSLGESNEKCITLTLPIEKEVT